jgi:hypothetical protein
VTAAVGYAQLASTCHLVQLHACPGPLLLLLLHHLLNVCHEGLPYARVDAARQLLWNYCSIVLEVDNTPGTCMLAGSTHSTPSYGVLVCQTMFNS